MNAFTSIEQMIVASAEAVRPPERLSVSEAAERYHYVNLPGTHVGFFDYSKTPYMREPNDILQSSLFTGGAFVGPARTGKSAGGLNWVASTVVCDPADMMIVHMTQSTGRDWSQSDLARMIRHSPEIRKRMVPGRQNDNVFDKRFLSGMRLLIKYPSISELSGKTIPRLYLMDYDRMPLDVEGEGNPFDLAKKRAATFRQFGMCFAEGSPGYLIEDPRWIPTTPHEAPPTKGLLSIYNRGDRRRWYWDCVHCHDPFEADFKHFDYPDSADLVESAEQAVIICPGCGSAITPEMKHEINDKGLWVPEGQHWDTAANTLVGIARRSEIASWWLKGPAAGFATWKTLVLNYLQAEDEYKRTGSEEALKTTVNVDQGLPYLMKEIAGGRLPEELKERAEDWGGSSIAPVVPHGVRFLVKTVDVQARSFVVQTHGVTDANDVLLIEMKKLRLSRTTNHLDEPEILDPAARPEDWDQLIDELEQSYPLADGSGRQMQIKIMGVDSGGAAGVTANAYAFWRRLRDRGDQSHLRLHLLKGISSRSAPRISRSMPDAQRKDRLAQARGEVPVYLINTDLMKDQVSAMLGRAEAGGMVRYPIWGEDWLYKQLTSEVRTTQGWKNIAGNKRNEAWDLLIYAIALCLHADIQLERPDFWLRPPRWADDWDVNTMVLGAVGGTAREEKRSTSAADLAAKLA